MENKKCCNNCKDFYKLEKLGIKHKLKCLCPCHQSLTPEGEWEKEFEKFIYSLFKGFNKSHGEEYVVNNIRDYVRLNFISKKEVREMIKDLQIFITDPDINVRRDVVLKIDKLLNLIK